MEQTLYERYAILDAEIERLGEQKENMRKEIIADMTKRGVEKEKHSLGQFTIAKLKRWTYPKKVVEFEKKSKAEIDAIANEIKAAKAKAESTGEATYEEQDSLRFTGVTL